VRLNRLALGPVRAAARSSRGVLEGEAERAIDALFAGPLPEAVGRSLVEHNVVERLASGMFDAFATRAPTHTRGVDGARRTPSSKRPAATEDLGRLTELLVQRVVESPQFKRALTEVLSSPAVRTALSTQASGFGDAVAAALRRRARAADQGLETKVRRLFRHDPTDESTGYGGAATRGVGLVLDALLAQLGFAMVAASLALVVALAGGLRPGWLGATLAGTAWFLATAIYFVAFWSATGQTPGMRVMRVRVVAASKAPLSVPRSIVRFVGLIVAVIPLFAGFLPVLFDARRRGLHDFISGTVVIQAKDDGASSEGSLKKTPSE